MRFTVELTRIANLGQTFTFDIKRRRGSARSYQWVYHYVRMWVIVARLRRRFAPLLTCTSLGIFSKLYEPRCFSPPSFFYIVIFFIADIVGTLLYSCSCYLSSLSLVLFLTCRLACITKYKTTIDSMSFHAKGILITRD